MRERNREYSVRLVKCPEGEIHYCTGRIVQVLSQTWNPEQKAWYLTCLVEHGNAVQEDRS